MFLWAYMKLQDACTVKPGDILKIKHPTVKPGDILRIKHPLVTCVYSVKGHTVCSLVYFVPL
jgi:hypothetical protein